MFKISFLIWAKIILVFSVCCWILALPTFGLALIPWFFVSALSLISIPCLMLAVYLLEKSQAPAFHALVILYILTMLLAASLSFFMIYVIEDALDLPYVSRLLKHPVFWIAGFCTTIGFYFSRKTIVSHFSPPSEQFTIQIL